MRHALIADDNAEGLYLLRCLLAGAGFQVVETRNGREALDAAKTQSFDLVISDILMPVMDGFSLCRALKADPRLRSTPFVFYTATYIDKRDEDFAMSLGADLFMVKPAEPTELLGRIQAVLSQRRTDKAPPVETPAETPFLQQYNAVLIHKLEDKLTELEKTNQALLIKDLALASSCSGILIADLDENVTYANPAILRMLGWGLGDVLGRPLSTLFTDADLGAWLQTSEAATDFRVLSRSPQEAIWLHVEKHTVFDNSGVRLGRMLSCADITEERRLLQELTRVQRLEALSLFAAGIAHDFNNLLMAIFSGLELNVPVRAGVEDREANRLMALAAFERARDLTRRLLTFAKHRGAERRPVDLCQLLDECISLSLSGSGVRCEKAYSTGPVIANVDPGQIAQVFSNLLVNARQAMNDRGTITARVERGAGAEAEAVVISIGDDGPGIPEDTLPYIFDPYFTTKKDGSGLGLATCQSIVHDHGGRISVASQAKRGTTFRIHMPGLPSETPLPQAARPAQVGKAQGRILILDDEPAIQSLLKKAMAHVGYEVVAVGRGEDAVVAFQRAQASGRAFDLFLSDLTVPGGMGGMETLAELRRLDAQILAVAMTGYDEDSVTAELKQQGFARLLPKPFLLHELFATIQAVLPRP